MASLHIASCLFDVVVFAGGDAPNLMPFSAFEPKHMLRICNRPLIWYCIAPWIDTGCRVFFICVNEDYAALRTYLAREFVGVTFYFVLVPLIIADHPSTTCDAVKAYLEFKVSLSRGEVDGGLIVRNGEEEMTSSSRDPLKAERAAAAGLPRDALLLSCDTILAGVDFMQFVENFYHSMASASVLLFRPYVEPPPSEKQGKNAAPQRGKKKGDQGGTGHKSLAYNYTCVAYSEQDSSVSMPGGCASSGTGASLHPDHGDAAAEGLGRMNHHCLHYMYPLEEQPELRITMAFAARRPHLTFAADVVDVHCYMVRHWALGFIAESAGVPDLSVRKYIMPLLARSQHTTVNSAEGVVTTPERKISAHIPTHWFHKGPELSVEALNAASGLCLPHKADNLRVFCTILEENPDVPMRVYCVNTRDTYQAANDDIIAAKCHQLQLAQPHGASTAPTANSTALSLLLPDNPFSLDQSIAAGRVVIVGSFIQSVPPPNVRITRSVIGPNVTLGAGAKVTDSIVMGDVEIGADAVISRSVIGASAVVNAGRRVVNSVVGPRCIVEQDEQDGILE